jgi:hypothetical protein
MSNIHVPTCLTGIITELTISNCMDGVSHQLNTITTPEPIRLKATTDEVRKVLREVMSAKATVSVCGDWMLGPEPNCNYLAVYHVSRVNMDITGRNFRVIALTASLPIYRDCAIVPEDAAILMIYSSVYGPASDVNCRQWLTNNCGK